MVVGSPRPFVVPLRSTAHASTGFTQVMPRIPTGVPDFDYLTGGLPTGSVVLLLGEAGAGHQEFALTSAVHLMLHYDDPELHQFFLGTAKGPFVYPEGVAFVSMSRSQEQVIGEVLESFHGFYPEVLLRHLVFHDLSPSYFRDSVVPAAWSSIPGPLLGGGPSPDGSPDGPVRALAGALDACGTGNVVIVDSLTDLLVRDGISPNDLLTLLKGLRRRAKEWNGLVYLLLSEGVAPAATEQAVIDSVDGVLHFRWTASPNHSYRNRAMLIEKFMPVLSRLPSEQQGRFVIRISAKNGLVTTQYERV
ncbi:MAG: RAD55 family ATPase [Thermoplasmata archaeon]